MFIRVYWRFRSITAVQRSIFKGILYSVSLAVYFHILHDRSHLTTTRNKSSPDFGFIPCTWLNGQWTHWRSRHVCRGKFLLMPIQKKTTRQPFLDFGYFKLCCRMPRISVANIVVMANVIRDAKHAAKYFCESFSTLKIWRTAPVDHREERRRKTERPI